MTEPWPTSFLDLHRQVDELFEELIYRPWSLGGRAGWRPALDIHETADGYLVELDLPGVEPEEVRVLAGEHSLTVAGQRRAVPPEGALWQRCERPSGPFRRVVALPRAVDPRRAHAEYRHGTCRVYLPLIPPTEGVAGPDRPDRLDTPDRGDAHYVLRVTVL